LIDILVYESFRTKIKLIAWAHLGAAIRLCAAKGVRL
jgi:hypothetical protein